MSKQKNKRNVDEKRKDEIKTQQHGTISFKRQPGLFQKTMIEDMEKLLIESDEQIKHLNQTITKIEQRAKNSTLFYQSKIADLQNIIERYRSRIQHLQGQKQKKDLNISHSSINRSTVKSSHKFMNELNKENTNTLNLINQPCSNKLCILQNEELRRQITLINRNFQNLIKSFEMRQLICSSNQVEQQWGKQFEQLKQRRKCDQRKPTLALLKNVQNKINELQKYMDNILSEKEHSKPLHQLIKNIKLKQSNLLKIPFLEKINLHERVEQYKIITNSCENSQIRVKQLIQNICAP